MVFPEARMLLGLDANSSEVCLAVHHPPPHLHVRKIQFQFYCLSGGFQFVNQTDIGPRKVNKMPDEINIFPRNHCSR